MRLGTVLVAKKKACWYNLPVGAVVHRQNANLISSMHLVRLQAAPPSFQHVGFAESVINTERRFDPFQAHTLLPYSSLGGNLGLDILLLIRYCYYHLSGLSLTV